MLGRLGVGLFLLSVSLLLTGTLDTVSSSDVQLLRVRRDTSDWLNTTSVPLIQDFGNGTTNAASTIIWRKCTCDLTGCDCNAEYSDFNSTKLLFRVEHIPTHTRFQLSFKDVNKTISKKFILVNGTSCFQFRNNAMDQICFLRYDQMNTTFLDRTCLALGVRFQKTSAVAVDFQCIKYMQDGTTHAGLINVSPPDLQFLANYTLYGNSVINSVSTLLLIASTIISIALSNIDT